MVLFRGLERGGAALRSGSAIAEGIALRDAAHAK